MTTIDQYALAAVKTFAGQEGHGFNANLMLDGKKIAFVYDDASGGPVRFDFGFASVSTKEPGLAYEQRKAAEMAFHDALVAAYDHAAYVREMNEIGAMEITTVQSESAMAESWVGARIDEHEERKVLVRNAKKHTLFRVVGDEKGAWRTLKNHVYGPATVAWIGKKYGSQVEAIFNPAAA